MTDPNYDPLEGYESVPSVSFDPSRGGIAENEWVSLEVTDYIKLVQSKDDNGKPEFYEDSGKPVMKFVLPVKLNGEERALWGSVIRKHDTALFAQLIAAQKQLRVETGNDSARIGPGVTIAVRWAWNTALPKKMGNHPKKYEVALKPGSQPVPKEDPLAATGDPWAEPATAGVGASRPNDEPPF